MRNKAEPPFFVDLQQLKHEAWVLSSKKIFLLAFPIALFMCLRFGNTYLKQPLVLIDTRETVCLFISLVVFLAFAGLDRHTDFYKRAITISFLLQTVFIDHRLAPFAIECMYTLWLLSYWDKRSIYLRLFNFVLSVSLMAAVVLENSVMFWDGWLKEGIALTALLRCVFVNYKFVTDSKVRGFEDVIISTLSIFLISRIVPISTNMILFVFIPACAVVSFINKSHYRFATMQTWQYFILATTGIIQVLALPLYLISLRPGEVVEEKLPNSRSYSVMIYALILMLFFIRVFSQDAFKLDLTGILALQWIFGNIFFVRILDKEDLHLTLLIFVIYLFY
ncbi:MAG: hypothetical protein A2X86_05205 [Bdellovibrionales bacterium GWA2_49_15]|nr:MAG: hypothetical protein A2X86_05205 [Bdellovibrionales bacterium GWA2_49_15]